MSYIEISFGLALDESSAWYNQLKSWIKFLPNYNRIVSLLIIKGWLYEQKNLTAKMHFGKYSE